MGTTFQDRVGVGGWMGRQASRQAVENPIEYIFLNFNLLEAFTEDCTEDTFGLGYT